MMLRNLFPIGGETLTKNYRGAERCTVQGFEGVDIGLRACTRTIASLSASKFR
jgi:hypothetical protein